MADHTHHCDVHKRRLDDQEGRLEKIDEILEKIRNRPPVWVTVVIGVLLTVIGLLAGGKI